jgi:phosphate uptake regulator
MLMSLVKDVERIGDYCKNLTEINEDGGGPIPDDEIVAELREIRLAVEETFQVVGTVFGEWDAESALDLIHRGREVNRRCDALLGRIARADYGAATTTSLVLGTRYYKRIECHLLNILSGVVMPLHKLDYYDEKSAPDLADDGGDADEGDGDGEGA